MATPLNPQGYYTNNTGYQQPQYTLPQYQAPSYVMQMPQQPMSYQRNTIQLIPVGSRKEAETYPALEPVYLIDPKEMTIYFKDQLSFRVFDLKEQHTENQTQDEYVTKKEFEELKQLIEDLTK